MSNQETLNQKIVFVLILFVIVIDITCINLTTLPITGRTCCNIIHLNLLYKKLIDSTYIHTYKVADYIILFFHCFTNIYIYRDGAELMVSSNPRGG